MIWIAAQNSGFFAVLTWFENSRGFLPLFPNVVPARRIAPGVFVPFGALRRHKLHIPRFHASMKARSFRCSSSSHKILRFCGSPVVAVMANTSPGDISHSDSHSIFKVQVLLQVQFNEKYALSRISKRLEKSAKQAGFPRLETERRRGAPCR